MKTTLHGMFLTLALAAGAVNSSAQVTINVNASERGDKINRPFGIFFEEINHAGDGGLYAELIQNRSFENYCSDNNFTHSWESFNSGVLTAVDASNSEVPMLNDVQLHAAKVVTKSANSGILNLGYNGINIVKGREYKVSLFARSATADTRLCVMLLSSDKKTTLGTVTLDTLTGEWGKYTATVKAVGNAKKGYVAVTTTKAATVYLDVVSLFPPTFNDRDNGMRIDLAQALYDLRPSFMRFPGGCYVEGLKSDFANGLDCHYEWKKSIGPIEERPGHRNNNWGYDVTDGMGALEYLLLCEDLHAEPLYVTNIGIGHDWAHNINDLDEYIQDALDFIEFCNGESTTVWGKRRVELGHEAPFNLRLLEIGNENNPMGNDVANGYYLRYKKFRDAIYKKYPYIQFIGNGLWSGSGWDANYPTDIIDEHYYNKPEFFRGKYTMYDNVSRSGFKHYVGEYAVTENFGKIGNLEAALNEAVYMCGIEKNAEAVTLASYAPIFKNDDPGMGSWWPTEMIHFNNNAMMVTPSYYMQQLFPQYQGVENVKLQLDNNVREVGTNHVGVGTWQSSSTYSDMLITLADGTTMTPPLTAADWTTNNTNGTWTYGSAGVSQSNDTKDNLFSISNQDINSQDYTFELKAKKNSGNEAFLILVNYIDADNWTWLNVGGWGNTKVQFEQNAGGSKSTVGSSKSINIATDRTYAIKITVKGSLVVAYVDGKEVCRATLTKVDNPKLFTSAHVSAAEDSLFLRVINPYPEAQQVTIHLNKARILGASGVIVSGSRTAENSWSAPNVVRPRDITTLEVASDSIVYEVPAYSANFINMKVVMNDVDAVELIHEDSSITCGSLRGKGKTYDLAGRAVDGDNLSDGFFITDGKKYYKMRK